MDWEAVGLSLRLAGWTTLVLLGVGLPLAWWLAVSSSRWKLVVEAVVALPLVLPPTVLGFYVLVGLGPNSPVGRLYQQLFERGLPFSFEGLLVASVLYSLPFAVQPFTAAFAAIDRRLLEAAWCQGLSPFQTFLQVVLPLARPGILGGMILSFAHTVGEFGVVLMVGGNIPSQTRTLSISIYDEVQALNYDAAGKTSAVLLLCSFAVLLVTAMLRRGGGSVWPQR